MTGLPPEAEREILTKLSANLSIRSDEVAAILARHGVEGDIDALQTAYRKRLGQRMLSQIRDEHGRRELLCSGSEYIVVDCGRRELLCSGSEYIVVDCCNDQQKLKAIQRRLQSGMNGLDASAKKVRGRIGLLERFKDKFQKAG